MRVRYGLESGLDDAELGCLRLGRAYSSGRLRCLQLGQSLPIAEAQRELLQQTLRHRANQRNILDRRALRLGHQRHLRLEVLRGGSHARLQADKLSRGAGASGSSSGSG